MFNLTEDFKEKYVNYVEAEASKSLDESLALLESANDESEQAFDLLREYFQIYAESQTKQEKLNEYEVVGLPPGTGPNSNSSVKSYSPSDNTDDYGKETAKTINLVLNAFKDPNMDKDIGYEPVTGYATVQKISEMKFPQNIIFFITQIINFIKTIILKFFGLIKNAFWGLLGKKDEIKPVSFDDVSLKMHSSKDVDNISIPVSYGAHKVFGKNNSYSIPDRVQLVTVDPKDTEKLSAPFMESASMLTEFDGTPSGIEPNTNNTATLVSDRKDINSYKLGSPIPTTKVYALKIDISRDLFDLEQYLQHFIDVFENSYGSNNEYLFGTEDLELLLQIFKKTLSGLKDQSTPAYEINGKYTEANAIDSAKLKDNLIRTKVNTDNLKEIYVLTTAKSEDILKIIQHKQILAASGMGISFKFYSASTYKEINNIVNILKPRLKEAEKMEKQLEKMEDAYEKVINELNKLRQSFMAINTMYFSTIYQKKIDDLFSAAKYMSQTITLRLTTIAIYIKELKEVQTALENANAINNQGGLIKRGLRKIGMTLSGLGK